MSFGVTLEATTMPAGPAEGRWVERCRGVREMRGEEAMGWGEVVERTKRED